MCLLIKSLYRREQIAGREDVFQSRGKIPLPHCTLPILPCHIQQPSDADNQNNLHDLGQNVTCQCCPWLVSFAAVNIV